MDGFELVIRYVTGVYQDVTRCEPVVAGVGTKSREAANNNLGSGEQASIQPVEIGDLAIRKQPG
jgi:hypothetical protein